MELGGRTIRLPGWLSSPAWLAAVAGAGVLAVVALAAGLAAGYAAGDRARGRRRAARAARLARGGAPATFPFAAVPALTQDTGACSVQFGHDLVLGVQLTNQSTQPLMLTSTKAVLPMGGLSQVTWQWATCGAVAAPPGQAGDILMPGESAWMAVTFRVKEACPGPFPVEFSVGYLVQGKPATASLPGFPDLGQVPYSGCGATTAADELAGR